MTAPTAHQDGEKISGSEKVHGGDTGFDHESKVGDGQVATHHSGTKRKLKPRQLHMIAIGGALGTALFVGSGRTLARGGPAFTLACFSLICAIILMFASITIELVAYLPITGATPNYFTGRYLSKSLGFAMGWTYLYSYGILVPYEVTVSNLIVHYWNSTLPDAAFITILLLVIVLLNLLPVHLYGESEYFFACLKILLVLGMIIISIVIAAGGGPSGEATGFKYWHDPGPAKHWIVGGSVGLFVGFLGTLVSVVFSFTFAVELMVSCAGEAKNPRKHLPIAAKTFIYRLVIFYVVSTFAVTLICPSDAPELTSGGAGAGASPYVVGIKQAGIKVLDHIVNGVVLSSAWSAGNYYMYLASRTLYSMALEGSAPRIFTTTNRWGVPWVAVLGCSLFALLAYLNVSSSSGVVFNWLVNMITMAAFFSWVIVSWTYLRFRKAVEVQEVDRSTFSYVSWCGKFGAWFCIVFFTILGLLNGFYVFFPSMWSISDFMTAYAGVLLFVVLYAGHKLTLGRKDPWINSADEIDLVSGMDEVIAISS